MISDKGRFGLTDKAISSVIGLLMAVPLVLSAAEIQPSIRCLSVHDNLSSGLVQDVVQDKDGYIWIATLNGLNRHDGYDFESFFFRSEDPYSISNNRIESLLVDHQGRLWVGGQQLNLFDPKTEHFIRLDVSAGRTIKSIHEDSNGNLWIGGNGFGLRQVAPDSGEVVAEFTAEPGNKNSLPDNVIRDIRHDRNGILWVATPRGIARIDPASNLIQTYFPSEMFPHFRDDQVRRILVDRQNRVWVSSPHGLLRRSEDGEWKSFSDDSFAVRDTWALLEDSNGQVWVGTDKQGMMSFRPDSDVSALYPASSYGSHTALPQGSIFSMAEDQVGALWVTVWGSGVCRFSSDEKKFELFRKSQEDEANGLSFDNLLDLEESEDGSVWIATDGGGLDRFDPQTGKFGHFKHNPYDASSLSSDSILTLREDTTGKLWVGTWAGGLNYFDPETGHAKHYRANDGSGLKGDNIFQLQIDATNDVWLSVWSYGLQKYDAVTERFIDFSRRGANAPFRVQNRHINFIHRDRNGDLWIGGNDGLEKVNQDNTVTTLSLTHQDVFNDIHEDSARNVLWFATSDGLVRYNTITENTVLLDKDNGFADSFITGIEIDNTGNLWLGSHRGLIRYSPETGKVDNYGPDHGLQGWEFNRFSHLRAKDGTLYFGGTSGLNHFSPDTLPVNQHIPPVYIEGLKLFHENVPIGPDAFLKQSMRYTDYLELPYQQNDITFRYTALDFAAPNYNRFRFRLEGFDAEWTEVSSDHREARYTNLPPGDYIFHVQASNNDGLWNKSGDSVKVHITTPWWMAWQTRSAAIACVFALFYLLMFLRTRRDQLRQRRLSQLVKEKTLALEEARLALEQANYQLQEKVTERTRDLQKEIEVRKNAEERLSRMAYNDALTGLPNRAWLMKRLSSLLGKPVTASSFALLFMDGDQFKLINDSMGHLAGDELLIGVSLRLQKALPEGAFLVRQSGDEFIVLIESVRSPDTAVRIANIILDSLKEPFLLHQREVFFNVSIGVISSSAGYASPDDLLQDADIAMYRAKQRGKACYQLFDQSMKDRAQLEIDLLSDMRMAIERDMFHLLYQPIIRLQDHQLLGFEALLRWNQPGRGPVSPDLFIRVAENNGLMDVIGLWVLRAACRQVNAWVKEYNGHPSIQVSINLSAKQLQLPDLPQIIQGVLAETKVDPARLKFEITETALMTNPDLACEILEVISDMGIKLAVDDFGTGYSSLNYIHRFPVQYLKIDRDFISKIEYDEEARIITKAMISMGQSLRQVTVAEGIENQAQLNLLKQWNCDLGQGFLIDGPLDAEAIGKWLSLPGGDAIAL